MANEHEPFDDELFDQRIHDAYEQVELSEEAQGRMLANLLAAQRNAQLGEASAVHESNQYETQALRTSSLSGAETEMLSAASPEPQRTRPKHAAVGETQVMRPAQPATGAVASDDAVTREQTEAQVLHMSSRKKGWQRWLPLAAVLAVALVVVQMTGVIGHRAQDANMSLTAKEAAPTSESIDAAEIEPTDDESAELSREEKALSNSYDAEAGAELPAMPVESEGAGQAVDVSTMTSVDFYPSIKLEDGTWFTALRDGLYVEEVDSSHVGESIGEGRASSFDDPDGESAVSCQVFKLLDDPDTYAVQYEGEDSYWRCAIVVE